MRKKMCFTPWQFSNKEHQQGTSTRNINKRRNQPVFGLCQHSQAFIENNKKKCCNIDKFLMNEGQRSTSTFMLMRDTTCSFEQNKRSIKNFCSPINLFVLKCWLLELDLEEDVYLTDLLLVAFIIGIIKPGWKTRR